MYFVYFDFRGELGFLNCDDVCMCVLNKQFELLEFVFDSVYVDLQYDEISLTFTAGSVFGSGRRGLMRGLGLGFTNPVGTGGVLDVCLCFGCGGVGGVGDLDQGLEGWCGVMSV